MIHDNKAIGSDALQNEWTRLLVKSDICSIRLLVLNLFSDLVIEDPVIVEDIVHKMKIAIQDFMEKKELFSNNLSVFYSHKDLKVSSKLGKEEITKLLIGEGFWLVDQDEFFLSAIKDGYDYFRL